MSNIIMILMSLVGYLAPGDSWKVSLNNKVVISSSKEDEAANTKQLSADILKQQGKLSIRYKPVKQTKGWRRSISIFDEDDNEVIRRDGGNLLSVSNAELKKLFNGKKQIRIFTMLTPTDPTIAARTRLRRVHLCTIELTN